MGAYITLGVATFFSALALLFLAVSFATDNWVETQIDRRDLEDLVLAGGSDASAINNSLYWDRHYFNRDRGLFRTCYDNENALWLDLVDEDDIVDTNCIIERGYELDRQDETLDFGDEYDTRIHLMRAHFAFYIVAMLLLIVAVVCGGVGCWRFSNQVLRGSAICAFAAVLFAAGGIAFFHGYEYLEKEELNYPPFPKFYLQYQPLDDNTSEEYGFSYVLGWLAVALSIVAGLLFVCSAWDIRSQKTREEKKNQPPPPQPQQYVQPVPMAAPAPSVYSMGSYQPQPTYQPAAAAPSLYGGYGY